MTPTPAPPSIDILLRHEAFVRGAARAVLGGDSEVDDVVQETWLAALSTGPRDPGRARAWLGSVARRLALLDLRRRVRARRREGGARSPTAPPDPAEFAAREEVRARLVRALLALEEPCRSAVLLRYYEGLMPREIARRLDVPVETVKTRIKRGLARLREHLADGPAGERRRRGAALAGLAGLAPSAAAGGVPAPAAAVLVLLAVVVGGALLLRDDPRPPPAGAPSPPGGDVHVARQPTLRGRALAAPAPGDAEDEGTAATGMAGGYLGRVVDEDEHPLAGAAVVIQASLAQRMLDLEPLPWQRFLPSPGPSEGPRAKDDGTVHTDADGRFAHPGPASVHARVLARQPGYAPRVFHAGASMRRADGTVDLGTLRLAPGATLRAVVLDGDGRAVAGATVAVQPPDGRDREGLERGELVRVARTDAAGRVAIRGLLPGDVLVGALDAAHPAVVERLRLAGGEVRDLTLRIARGRSLRVEVRERGSQRPLAGARVDVLARGPTATGVSPADADEASALPPPAGDHGGPAEPVRVASVRTGEDGIATLEGLPTMLEAVVVVPPDLADVGNVQPPPFSLRRAPGEAGELRFELAPAIDLPILVDADPLPATMDVEARPAPGFEASGGMPSALRAEVAIDASGAGRLRGLRPGPWRVRGFAKDALPFDVQVVVQASRPAARLDLRLEPATARAAGRVAGPDGPVAGAKVWSYEWIPWLGGGQVVETTSAADGSFELRRLLGRPQTLLVRVSAEGFVDHEVRVAAADRTGDLGTIGLVRPGRIAGSGAPAGGRVQATPLDPPRRGKGPWVEATADAAGRFVLEGLAPGRWQVRSEDGAAATVPVVAGQEATAVLAR